MQLVIHLLNCEGEQLIPCIASALAGFSDTCTYDKSRVVLSHTNLCLCVLLIPSYKLSSQKQPRIQEFAMGGAVYQRGGNVCEAV